MYSPQARQWIERSWRTKAWTAFLSGMIFASFGIKWIQSLGAREEWGRVVVRSSGGCDMMNPGLTWKLTFSSVNWIQNRRFQCASSLALKPASSANSSFGETGDTMIKSRGDKGVGMSGPLPGKPSNSGSA